MKASTAWWHGCCSEQLDPFRWLGDPHPTHESSQLLHRLIHHVLVSGPELLSQLVEQRPQPHSVQLLP
jgi:hypothetical protein